MADHFDILGVPKGFRLDEKALEERHRELTRLLHPDRHAAAGRAARRVSLEKMIQVNDAYRILRDPARRAAWLLQERGVDLSESGAQGAGRHLPQEFLLEVMELREELAEAKYAKDHARISGLATRVKGARTAELDAVGAAFDADDTAAAARHVAQLRYYDRFLDEVSAFEDETFEESHG